MQEKQKFTRHVGWGNTRRFAMKSIRSKVVLAAVFAVAGGMCFAQAGEATYKAKCQSCHGATGTPNPGIAKLLGVKPANDPAVKKLTPAEMEAVVKNGKGKMKPVAGLSDSQVKEVVAYFRELGKK
jgi:mono/diheme cytochrome c family protein